MFVYDVYLSVITKDKANLISFDIILLNIEVFYIVCYIANNIKLFLTMVINFMNICSFIIMGESIPNSMIKDILMIWSKRKSNFIVLSVETITNILSKNIILFHWMSSNFFIQNKQIQNFEFKRKMIILFCWIMEKFIYVKNVLIKWIPWNLFKLEDKLVS